MGRISLGVKTLADLLEDTQTENRNKDKEGGKSMPIRRQQCHIQRAGLRLDKFKLAISLQFSIALSTFLTENSF